MHLFVISSGLELADEEFIGLLLIGSEANYLNDIIGLDIGNNLDVAKVQNG